MTRKKVGANDPGELRQRAEARVCDARADADAAAPPDPTRLLHELQVYQVELEMQNEELRQARAALEESLSCYSDLYESAPVGYLSLGRDGSIRQVNLTGARLLGQERSRLMGRAFDLLLAPQSRAAFRTFLANLNDQQTRESCEVEMRPEGAPPIVLELTGTLAEDRQECRVVVSDITERKLAEQELRAKKALLEAQANATLDGILVVDPGGRKIFQNRQLVELWSIPPEVAIDPDDARQVAHVMHSTKHPEQFVERITYLYEHPNETTRDEVELVDGTVLDRYSAPVVDRDGTQYGRIWTFRDITERKRAEAKRAQLEAQLLQAQKLEGIGRLAGGIAHDFNNCLSVIQGFTSLALARLPEDDPLAADLGQVVKASERAARLVHQLLAFGRKQVLQPDVLDLNQVLGELERMLRRIIGEDIDLRLVPAPDLGLVKADLGQVGQVIMNLVINARDAMPKGGRLTIETGNVELDAEAAAGRDGVGPGAYVTVTVADSGVGMGRQTMAHIFEPFFTTKAVGEGSGLGLSTVYGIIKQSGGGISVDSEVGVGTIVKVYLPRELSINVTTAAGPQPLPRQAKGAQTILLVEDEPALRHLTVRLLERAGYRVLSAEDGEDALLACERHAGTIDLLLTDVVMPRMGGRELAERLLTMRPAIRVLYMSGYADDALLHHDVLDAGAHFIAKPFDAAGLTRKVGAVLDGSLAASRSDLPAVLDQVEPTPMTEAASRVLAPDVLAGLRQAVAGANHDDIVDFLEPLRATAPDTVAVLRRLVDDFDYDGMTKLLG